MYNSYFKRRAFHEKRNSKNSIENEIGIVNKRKAQILLSKYILILIRYF